MPTSPGPEKAVSMRGSRRLILAVSCTSVCIGGLVGVGEVRRGCTDIGILGVSPSEFGVCYEVWGWPPGSFRVAKKRRYLMRVSLVEDRGTE